MGGGGEAGLNRAMCMCVCMCVKGSNVIMLMKGNNTRRVRIEKGKRGREGGVERRGE